MSMARVKFLQLSLEKRKLMRVKRTKATLLIIDNYFLNLPSIIYIPLPQKSLQLAILTANIELLRDFILTEQPLSLKLRVSLC